MGKERTVEVFFLNKKTIELEEGQKKFTAMSIPDGAMESKEALMKAVYLNSIKTEEYEVTEFVLPNVLRGKGNVVIRIAESNSIKEKNPFVKPILEKINFNSEELAKTKNSLSEALLENNSLNNEVKDLLEINSSLKCVVEEKRERINSLEKTVEKEMSEKLKLVERLYLLKKEVEEASFLTKLKYLLGLINFG